MKNIHKEIKLIESYRDYPWYNKLQLQEEINYLQEIEDNIVNYSPKIAVIGEFSSGKSTLINAFLGRDILPAKYRPTTQFITKIRYCGRERITIDGEELEVTKENLEKIDTVQANEINLYLSAPILKQWTFIDTPGTNDPSTFTDDIVFDLVGDVDVVLFVFNSMSALRETEKQFLSKLIRKKDIGKFFFILNWADSVDEPLVVKNDFVDRLTSLLGLERNLILNHTFVFSAKDSLANRITHKADSRFDRLNDTLNSFVLQKKSEFIDEVISRAIENAKSSILFKIETLEEKINGQSNNYEEEQAKIKEQMKSFELAISKEMLNFERQFNELIHQYKTAIGDSIKFVKNEIRNDISDMDYKELISSRYIELRTKKLLEDRVEDDTKIFAEQMAKLVEDFNEKIKMNEKVNSLHIGSLQNKKKAKTVVNIAAVGAVVAGGTAVAPAAGTMLATASVLGGIGSVSPFLVAIPVVGPFLAGATGLAAAAVPVMGVFALAAGQVLFDVGKWGIGVIGTGLEKVEEKAARTMYLKKVDKSLSEIEIQLLAEIDKININTFREKYIESLFPEKVLLENKMKLLKEKQLNTQAATQEQISELEQFKMKLEY
jgi:small GTP-binding protein